MKIYPTGAQLNRVSTYFYATNKAFATRVLKYFLQIYSIPSYKNKKPPKIKFRVVSVLKKINLMLLWRLLISNHVTNTWFS